MFGISKKVSSSTLISSNMYIKGTVKSNTEIYNDGVIEGEVDCKILIIGLNGKIKSNTIHAEKIVIHGEIEGNIDAASVYLGASARINGNILHNEISIQNGAFISGEIKQKRSNGK